MKNAKIKFGAFIVCFTKAVNRVNQAFDEIRCSVESYQWSAKMCERIDEDNIRHTGSPLFARTLDEVVELPCLPIESMLSVVQICELDQKESHTEIFHSRMRNTVCNQMIACGFSIDYEDSDGVSFSRWMADKTLQFRRIQFR